MSDDWQRLAELGLLHRLGQFLSGMFDLPDLLNGIAEAALTLTQADEALICLAEADGGPFEPAASRRVHPEQPVLLPHLPDSAARIIQAGEVLFLGGAADGSQIHVPLRGRGRIIGGLSVARASERDAFLPYHADLLRQLADYATIAIENARLYQEAVERNVELGLLVESSFAISSSLDLGRVLNAIARHMMRGLRADWCIISSWSAAQNCCVRLAEHRQTVSQLGEGVRLSRTILHCHYEFIAQHNKPLAVQIVRPTASPQQRRCLTALGGNRLVLLPLQSDGQLIGVMDAVSLYNDAPLAQARIGRAFRTVLEIAELVASGAYAQEQTNLFDATRTLLSACNADWCSLYHWDAAGRSLERLMTYGNGVWSEQPGPQLKIGRMPTLEVVLREQRITVLRSTAPDLTPAERSLFRMVGPSAMLALPLVARGQTVGLVQLYDLDPQREFSAREMRLAHALASQAAVALENARLVRDLQHSLEEQKAMQSQLIRAVRLSALGELAAAVAHQINNPLTTILGDAELLAQDTPPDSPAHESAQAILRAGLRAKRAVERMLALTRVDNEVTTQSLTRTIRETLDLITPHLRKQRIALSADLAADDLPVAAIPGQLEDVWLNLLLNAYDAVLSKGDAGHIMVRSRRMDDSRTAEVCVEDNGIGIQPEHLKQVFDPFFTTKPRGRGTGLGLYICRQIVRDHHGSITIESTPGEGTRVTVRLPLLAESAG